MYNLKNKRFSICGKFPLFGYYAKTQPFLSTPHIDRSFLWAIPASDSSNFLESEAEIHRSICLVRLCGGGRVSVLFGSDPQYFR